MFEAIHRHGALPVNYLYEFTDKKNYNTHQHRLTKLFNGTAQGNYLTRPPQQFASFHARYQPVVYDLTDKAKILLDERGKLSPFIYRTDPFVHRLMGACVGASIELACTDIGYIPRHDVLKKRGKQMELPLSKLAPQKYLVPDDLFGFDYGGAYRFFAVEIDRNTESISRKNLEQNTFGKKLASYIDVMKNRTFTSEWGIPNLMVLTITTNETHMRGIMEHIKTLDQKFGERFLFKALPNFGANWRVPMLLDMFEPWVQVGSSTFDIFKP